MIFWDNTLNYLLVFLLPGSLFLLGFYTHRHLRYCVFMSLKVYRNIPTESTASYQVLTFPPPQILSSEFGGNRIIKNM